MILVLLCSTSMHRTCCEAGTAGEWLALVSE